MTDHSRDWTAELRERQRSGEQYVAQVGIGRCPEHLIRWLEVFGDAAGTSPGRAASFAIGEGCRMQLSPAAVDTVRDARKVIRQHGTPSEWKGAQALAFEPATPEGYGSRHVTFKVTTEDRAACDALASNLGMKVETAAKIGILSVLADVPAVPREDRRQLIAERKRWRRYLETWAEEVTRTAAPVQKRQKRAQKQARKQGR